MGQTCSEATLAAKKSVGAALEVNLKQPLKHTGEENHPTLQTRADITKSPNQNNC